MDVQVSVNVCRGNAGNIPSFFLKPYDDRGIIKDMATKIDTKNMLTKADSVEIKADLAEIKADLNAIKWMMGLLLAINVAFIVSAVGLMISL